MTQLMQGETLSAHCPPAPQLLPDIVGGWTPDRVWCPSCYKRHQIPQTWHRNVRRWHKSKLLRRLLRPLFGESYPKFSEAVWVHWVAGHTQTPMP